MSRPPKSALADWVFSIVLFAVTLHTGLSRSQARDLTGDEHWTRLIARLPLSESVPFMIHDGKHPPLYPVIQMLGAFVLPDTALGLRFFSLLAVSLVPVVVYWLAKDLWQNRVGALGMASWVGLHPLLLIEAANARSYALLALAVALYASALVRWIVLPARGDGLMRQAAVFASLAALLHAFGILFVLSLSAASLVYLWIFRGGPGFWAKQGSGRILGLAHAPAVLLVATWFLVISVATRDAGGITDQLDWVKYPGMGERLYVFGLLLGNPDFGPGTLPYLGLWGIIGTAVFWLCARRRVWPILGLMIVAAGLAPFIAQMLVSGIVVKLPFWGVRHVSPTPVLLSVGVLVSVRGASAGRWPQFLLAALFGAMAAVSAIEGKPHPRNALSQFAAQVRATGDSTPIRVADEINTLSTLNFHFDRRCLDARQLRALYPQVAGPASALPVGPFCRAAALRGELPLSETRLFLVHRHFVPEEVAARNRLLETGWRQESVVKTSAWGEVIELLERSTPSPDS